MSNSFNELLAKFAESPLSDSKKWDVLTALRGPDNIHGFPEGIRYLSLKAATTAVIRRKFGLRVEWGDPFEGIFISTKDTEENKSIRVVLYERILIKNPLGASDPSIHFTHHAFNAFEVLGLKWDEVNAFEEKEEK